jgi:hypothetical protein
MRQMRTEPSWKPAVRMLPSDEAEHEVIERL